MCMGYAKEIKAWLCDDALSRRDVMMEVWSLAFDNSDEAIKSSVSNFAPERPANTNHVQCQQTIFPYSTVLAK